jgi:hypothetical protein
LVIRPFARDPAEGTHEDLGAVEMGHGAGVYPGRHRAVAQRQGWKTPVSMPVPLR